MLHLLTGFALAAPSRHRITKASFILQDCKNKNQGLKKKKTVERWRWRDPGASVLPVFSLSMSRVNPSSVRCVSLCPCWWVFRLNTCAEVWDAESCYLSASLYIKVSASFPPCQLSFTIYDRCGGIRALTHRLTHTHTHSCPDTHRILYSVPLLPLLGVYFKMVNYRVCGECTLSMPIVSSHTQEVYNEAIITLCGNFLRAVFSPPFELGILIMCVTRCRRNAKHRQCVIWT